MGKAEPSLISQLRKQADASVTVTDQGATGAVGFVRTKGDLMPGRSATNARSAASKVDAYLAKYASVFGASSEELAQTRVASTPFGWTVSYRQSYKGVTVWGAELKAHVADNGDLTAVTGYVAPDLGLDVAPSKSATDAAARAIAFVRADPPRTAQGMKAPTPGLRVVTNQLVVYRNGIVKGEAGDAVLAYDLEVSNITPTGGNVRDRVILDANSLKPINRYSMMPDALDRTLKTTNYDPTNKAHDGVDKNGNPAPNEITTKLVWSEGQNVNKMDQEQKNLMDSSAESYWMHMNTWGIDSYDDAGAERVTLHNRPDACPNASWNGSFTSYCAGVYDDDTVAHEWGHAYTEYQTGLIYQWQSGALNESYSDIWGETVDLLNGREDEGEGDLTAKRPDGLCSSHSPALPTLSIDSPESIAKICLTGGASFGAPPTAGGLTGEVTLAADAVEDGGTATDGCSPYTNQAAAAGKIVMVDRGLCSFEEKAKMATQMGAAALIIGNRDDAPIGMSGSDTTVVTTVSIGLADRESIRSTILAGTPVTVTIKDATTAQKSDSYRWLLSEKSSAFGGAIRDMWNPTCHGDPGKVSDAEYKCSSDDSGGVHGNSGVPNHGYALLVDGGTFNGQTVEGLGFDKAANIYFYAQNYMGPTSDFVDHADSLEQACADLTGQAIKKLSFTAGANPGNADPITAADCTQVSTMIAAVELRLDPTVKCKWKPLLDPNAPPLCGEGMTSKVVFADNFDAGLDAWTKDQKIVYTGGIADPWQSTSTYPGRQIGGSVAYAPALDKGDCSGLAGDYSSSDSITSPSIVVPTGQALRLSFDHYIATEAKYDGGNVKLSVNGGAFAPIQPAAYVFNAPNLTLDPAVLAGEANSTNPLAGEPGFSGTNPGAAFGSWGNSQVNLEAAGAKAGDTIQIRFDLGRDGCGGVNGWYVDNVSVTVCEPGTTTPPTTTPTTTPPTGTPTTTPPTTTPTGTPTTTPPTTTPTPTSAVDSDTAAKVRPAKPSLREDFRVVVKVTATGTTPTGRVVVRIDGKLVGAKVLRNGKIVLKVKKDLALGKHTLVAV